MTSQQPLHAPTSTSHPPELTGTPPHMARTPHTLVLCFDGTNNQYNGENTNVVKLFSLLEKTDEQICYYQPGVGTYTNPGILSPVLQWGAKVLDEAFAWYLDGHVMGGYQFLMDNYCDGDKICLFGFSRGAYTARALAGMLTKVGLLPKDNVEQIPFAYKMFTQTGKNSMKQCEGFRETFCRDVCIEFLGVWETVASVGILMTKTLPFTTKNGSIKVFRQALSLDEHRTRFQPEFFHRTPPKSDSDVSNQAQLTPVGVVKLDEPQMTEVRPLDVAPALESGDTSGKKARRQFPKFNWLPNKIRNDNTKVQPNGTYASINSEDQGNGVKVGDVYNGCDVLEVWFSGCHADIGGSATPNDTLYALSDITLRWMVRQIIGSQCGITFVQSALEKLNIDEGGPLDNPDGSGSPDSQLDNLDAIQPINDELVITKSWWLLEIVPTQQTWQDENGKWHSKWSFHLGNGRYIPMAKPVFHQSVQTRMNNASLNYTPRAHFTPGSQIYTS